MTLNLVLKIKQKREWVIPQLFASQQPNNNQDYGNHESICISAPTPGKAKNPTNQSIKIITTIVNSVFMANSSTKS
jgi:hypothetical protein